MLHITAQLIIRLFLMGLLAATSASALSREPWNPVTVDVWEPAFNDERLRVEKTYEPLSQATESWRLCVLIPHLKDAYWLAVNFAVVDEARRLGVHFALFNAGGYGNLQRQREQFRECLNQSPDGIILSAVSSGGFDEEVAAAARAAIPVVDLINGVFAPDISARVGADFWDLGNAAAQYLADRVGDAAVRVAWLPGPVGAGWVEAGDGGFREAVAGTGIDIADTLYGDTGYSVQRGLIEKVLDEQPVDYVVGTAPTAEAATGVLRERGLSEQIGVVAHYYSPGVHRGIRRGHVLAAPTDMPALQTRIAMDTLVRIIEGEPYFAHVGAAVVMVDRERLASWDPSVSLSPRGFRPVYNMGWH
jgi:protein TorT